MATYDSLSADDKAVVQNTVNLVRAGAGERARAWNRQKAIADDSNAVNLITGLDDGEVIPNTSGLAGADDLTKDEVVDLYNLLNNDRTTNDTSANRAKMSKAAGINAMISE